jgi:hypothetical protein
MQAPGNARPLAISTDAVSVVYTGFIETLRAARVGAALAAKMNVPLRIVHFRTVPRQLDVDRPNGLSPIESETFTSRLLEEGISARARVYLCRDETKTIPYAFKPHSIVVVGGHHSWLPTRVERWRHALEDAGQFVVLVEPSAEKEHVDA